MFNAYIDKKNQKNFSDLRSALDYVRSTLKKQGFLVSDEVELDDDFTSLQEVYESQPSEFEWLNVIAVKDGEESYAAIISNLEMIADCGDDEDDDDDDEE